MKTASNREGGCCCLAVVGAASISAQDLGVYNQRVTEACQTRIAVLNPRSTIVTPAAFPEHPNRYWAAIIAGTSMNATKPTPAIIGVEVGVAGDRFSSQQEQAIMDKDRIAGAAHEVKGSVKETVGKAVGDGKLQSDGKAEKTAGKVQNAVGDAKDTLRDIVKK